MKKYIHLAVSVGAAVSISACTAGQTGPPNQTTIDPTINGNGKLSLAVGTANIAGAGVGLNVVPLFRQKNGSSAVLVDAPKLTGPFILPKAAAPDLAAAQYDANSTADVGPSANEVTNHYIGGSPQPTQIGLPSATNSTFGVYGGVFGNGFAPVNYGTGGLPQENVNGSAVFYPYFQPFYAGVNASFYAPANPPTGAPLTNTFLQTASAPAFDPAGNGHGPTGPNFPQNALSLGLNVFKGVTPVAGAYTLNAIIQTTGSVIAPPPASATLTNAGLVLPVATVGGAAPAVTFNGDGTFTVTNVSIAAPTVGAYVEVIDAGPSGGTGCNGASSSTPVFYTKWVTATGPAAFSNANAPYGQTTAVCTAAQNTAAAGATTPGDTIQVVVIGFDYNEYALQYNGPTGATYPQAPTLPAQADSSISLSTYATSI